MYAYGSCSKYTNTTWETAAWCLKAYAHECDGVLPWQSLGKGLNKPDGSGNSLIVNAGNYGNAIASFRVHAFRRGAQDCELLRILQLKHGWSRQHMGMLASQKVPLTSQYKQKFVDEAAALTFGKMTAQGFCEMKEGILKLIEQAPSGKTGKRTSKRRPSSKIAKKNTGVPAGFSVIMLKDGTQIIGKIIFMEERGIQYKTPEGKVKYIEMIQVKGIKK
jgi:hypothetical protein